ncbi:molybdopterin-dependent oxidoreductase [Microbacterium imperiale]|uniref:Oxidoreductase n=1 Tax=Microbacterium imperiale TaxID=33884 RepID=A0A9W6M3V1_9MICO|nr:molybdopterin-dependent oxidoreductase [Microbacterium imperiale]MBP2421095.1 DMSO/TMAO reductase YedYZ molybdopterin-dependent catalytic subunit [Microbacterium imperiale]MDS0199793.1 molybdopterin-dependent oxidoreductase [Microbacterium imperiale]BFE41435.1 molybdopterin-dependent oxidoreductase [Microbacterium imperiale]GLJ80386.1 putative oxidoreductase [Microbacterium imperiale]
MAKTTAPEKRDRTRRRGIWWLWSALAGVVSAAAFLAVAELIALLVARESSPILAVGAFVIDIVPQPLKEFAIATFGAADKIVLLGSLGLAVLVAAAIAGILQFFARPFGLVVIALAGVLSTAAIVTRTGASPLAFLPPVVGTLVGAAVLVLLITRLRRWAEGTEPASERGRPDAASADAPNPRGLGRRSFLLTTAGVGAAAVIVGIGSRLLNATTASIDAARRELRLPEPRSTVTIPEGAELDVEGISPLITPNADFYRVDTALTVPSVDPNTWRLVIDGMVDQRVELSFDDLVGMGLDEYAVTLTCVSNEVGGGLVGNAIWQGVPIRDILRMAGPKAGADMVLSRSVDGYTASTPLDALTDESRDAIFAVAMNGEPLPLEHGFPVRMVVPGLYGYVSATKWVTELKVTTFEADEAYWTPRGYAAEAPIKFSSRIDTPRTGTPVPAGTVAVAGMAWAQTVGIERVEVRIDDGDWQAATLSTPINSDTWVQWVLEWQAEAGTHYVEVRAVNKNGDTQIEERAPIAPDGSSGWQRVLVTVSA